MESLPLRNDQNNFKKNFFFVSGEDNIEPMAQVQIFQRLRGKRNFITRSLNLRLDYDTGKEIHA